MRHVFGREIGEPRSRGTAARWAAVSSEEALHQAVACDFAHRPPLPSLDAVTRPQETSHVEQAVLPRRRTAEPEDVTWRCPHRAVRPQVAEDKRDFLGRPLKKRDVDAGVAAGP